MADDNIFDAVTEKIEPSRRKFLLGLLAAGVTAPTVASFVMGQASGPVARTGTPIRPASLIDSSGNFNMTVSGQSYTSCSNSIYQNFLSGNFLRDANGNFILDGSGNLLCGTSGNILLDASGQALIGSGNNLYILNPSGNWSYDPYGQINIGFTFSGNPYQWLQLSGNNFYDKVYSYDSNGVTDYSASPQVPGMACVVSANHIRVQQAPQSTTAAPQVSTTVAQQVATTTAAPQVTTTVAPSTTTTTSTPPLSGTLPTVK